MLKMAQPQNPSLSSTVEEAFSPHMHEYRLAIMAESSNSVEGYVAAHKMSDDQFMKSYYASKAVSLVRENPGMMNYSKCILFCKDIGRHETAKALFEEMVKKHPLLGRINYLPLKIAARF